MVNNTSCFPLGDVADTLEDGKSECKNNKQCIGVVAEGDFNETQSYHLCPKNATTVSENGIASYMYEKYIVGKLLEKHYLRTQCIIINRCLFDGGTLQII